ncbi:hypothetical protein ACFL6U_09855 [Planctomycetota bacterium]
MPESSLPIDSNTTHEVTASQRFFAAEDLQGFKHATNDVMQDAINVWDELWAELESQKVAEGEVAATAAFVPSCGWPEFLQKMWVLRNHLNFVKRISR